MSILKTVAVPPELKETHMDYFSYLLQYSKPPQNPMTLLWTEGVRGVEGRQEVMPGLLFYLLFMILWVRAWWGWLISAPCGVSWACVTGAGGSQVALVTWLECWYWLFVGVP